MELLTPNPDITTSTVGEIATQYPGAIQVFNKYNIDFCCGGKKQFLHVCKEANLEPKKIMEELFLAEGKAKPGALRVTTWQPPLLVNFILENHHTYVKQSIPELRELLNKVCAVHGEDQPSLYEVRKQFEELSTELLHHLTKEEQVLFPAILSLYEGRKNTSIGLEHPILVMEDEHEHAGHLMKSIRELTNNYTPPAFACPTFQMTYKLLQEFEEDLMQHIHLENNILFERIKQHQTMSTL